MAIDLASCSPEVNQSKITLNPEPPNLHFLQLGIDRLLKTG